MWRFRGRGDWLLSVPQRPAHGDIAVAVAAASFGTGPRAGGPVLAGVRRADLCEKVDGGEGRDREVLSHLTDREACTAWLRKLVSKPEIALRHVRLSAPQRVALLQEGSDVA